MSYGTEAHDPSVREDADTSPASLGKRRKRAPRGRQRNITSTSSTAGTISG